MDIDTYPQFFIYGWNTCETELESLRIIMNFVVQKLKFYEFYKIIQTMLNKYKC